MPDDRHDDWFEPEGEERRPQPEPVRRARTEPPEPSEARRPALVAAAAILAVVILVVVVIVSAVGGDGDEEEAAPPAATGEVLTEAPETVPAETGATTQPPPATGSALPATGPLKIGDEGDEVVALQEALVQLGFDAGEADGIFGQQTQAAVRAFQEQQGLSADGIAGAQTLEAIRNALAQTEG